MNLPSFRPLLLTAGVLLLAAPAGAAPASSKAAPKKAVDRYERIQERIDALIKNRLKPDPLPAILPNPFQLSEAFPLTENPRTPGGPTDHSSDPAAHETKPPVDAPPTGSDAEILAYYAATLRISGTVELNGRPQLVINQSPYKEGDLILLRHKDANVYLRVVHIAPGELTLGYKAVEQILKFSTK